MLLLSSLVSIAIEENSIAPPQIAEESEFKVVATTSLLADFASNILEVEIESIIPPGVCPAHFDPSTSEVAVLAGADIVLCHGFEAWLDDLLEGADNMAAKKTIGPLVGGASWNVPTNAIDLYLPALATIFSETYPAYNSTFENNVATYITDIEENATNLLASFESSPNANAKVAVMTHQQNFARWLGLDVVVVWNASDEAMSAKDIAIVVEMAQDQDVSIFISNKPSGTNVGAEMAEEVNADHKVMANFPGDESTTDYIDMITQNVNRLEKIGSDEKKEIPGYPQYILFFVSGVATINILKKVSKKSREA